MMTTDQLLWRHKNVFCGAKGPIALICVTKNAPNLVKPLYTFTMPTKSLDKHNCSVYAKNTEIS